MNLPDELFEIEELGIYELLPALHTTIIAINPERRDALPWFWAAKNRPESLIVE